MSIEQDRKDAENDAGQGRGPKDMQNADAERRNAYEIAYKQEQERIAKLPK